MNREIESEYVWALVVALQALYMKLDIEETPSIISAVERTEALLDEALMDEQAAIHRAVADWTEDNVH
ncbi:MAG: hypothetical protein GWO38_20565 [Phycisphaerae bacterium]|nr:hypothetical protein [Phycisphaerae bacterium]NIP55123.1 hypothetical protein [Phycisphaerae bacterium]NIX29959.1 hypothetical protein [Phycisphaerae bacterium]